MGVHPLISHDKFPEQSKDVGELTKVFYGDKWVDGLVVRDDVNFPRLNRRIIAIDPQKYIIMQFSDDATVSINAENDGRPLNELYNPIFKNGGYPQQGSWLNKRTKVCFCYDTSHTIMGTIVRNDNESPWEGIIRLDDGRFIFTGECQHSPE